MKKDKITRDNHEKTQFVRLTTTTLFDEKLTDSACRLLIAMLNNNDEWEVNVTYYANKLGWSGGKTTNAKRNLIECGYLKERIEMTSKGRIYHYNIIESPENKETSQHPVSKDWKPNIGNQRLEAKDWKIETNNSNITNNSSDKSNPEKIKEIKISESVSVRNQLQITTEPVENTNADTPFQLKNDFFFSYGERPNEEKIITYVEQKGYSRAVGSEIFLELHSKDFKTKSGSPIKGVERYIDSMLSDRSKHSHSTSIDSFLEAVKPVNEWYINKSIENNKDLSIDKQTSMLYAKEASREYWTSISKDKNEYITYMKSYIELKGWKSMANFKSYIFKHRERQIQGTGKTYV